MWVIHRLCAHAREPGWRAGLESRLRRLDLLANGYRHGRVVGLLRERTGDGDRNNARRGHRRQLPFFQSLRADQKFKDPSSNFRSNALAVSALKSLAQVEMRSHRCKLAIRHARSFGRPATSATSTPDGCQFR